MADDAVNRLFQQIRSDWSGIVRRAPMAIGRIAINFMEENFEKGGFQAYEGGGVEKWLPRKHDDGSGRAILVGKQSGRLMKSGTIFKADEKSVIVGVPDDIAEYGKIHNEGGTVHPQVTDKMKKFAWFKYKETGEDFWKGLALTKKKVLSITIPRRQFLGNSPELTRRISVFYLDSFKTSLKNNTTFK